MSKRFLFSMKTNGGTQGLLKAMALQHLVTCTPAIVVVTDNESVAGLLTQLDTAEEILPAPETITIKMPPYTASNVLLSDQAQPKPAKAKRKPQSGPYFECPSCHQRKPSGQMTKAGLCKVCHMRELKAAAGKKGRKAGLASYNPLTDKPDYSQLEAQQEKLARPREKLNITNLSGVKVG